MPFINRFWHTFRLGLLVIMFIATTFYLLITTPWAKYFGRPPSYASVIQEGQPIVDAIYHFKQQRGLWPEYLDDISPQFLPKPPRNTWYYELTPVGPSLAISPRRDANYVGFNFDPVTPAWRANEDGVLRTVKTLAPPTPTTLPHESVIQNELAELDRRIIADHALMQHFRAKASLLKSLHRLEETRTVVQQAADADANNFWPRLAAVALDLGASPASASAPATVPSLPPSFADFEAWATTSTTFTKLYYLALADRLAGRNTQALALIAQAAKLPPITAGDDMEKPAFYLWDMARFAFKQKNFPLVLTLTTAWEKMQSDGRAEENSYLALAAAAKLATGQFTGAQADLDKLTARKTPTWAQNLPALQNAITRKDTAFVYNPGPTPPPFQIFALPQ